MMNKAGQRMNPCKIPLTTGTYGKILALSLHIMTFANFLLKSPQSNQLTDHILDRILPSPLGKN